jgi:DNA-binding winged helix-turn-helix (wHTH) protein
MIDTRPARRYRFGVFEVDSTTGELRRRGVRVKLHAQPFQVLFMLLERPGEMLTRDEICRELWPDGTFVDYEHGVNSAVNRLRDALGDKANNPRFIETLARRGYRFLAPVERIAFADEAPTGDIVALVETAPANVVRLDVVPLDAVPLDAVPLDVVPLDLAQPVGAQVDLAQGLEKPLAAGETPAKTGFLDRLLAAPEDLPGSSHAVVQTLFLLLQVMYMAFYVGALANLAEINELFSPLSFATGALTVTVVTAVLLIPVRTFLICAVLFHAPKMREKFLKIWPLLLLADVLWSLAPFLLLHHINYGLALACVPPLVYSPFAQRSLILMGAGEVDDEPSASLR